MVTAMSQSQSDIARRLHNVASFGTIADVDHATGRVRVNVNGRLTGWLPAPGSIGQNFRAWSPTRVGTQVLVTSPSGDPANGVVSQILYSQGLPPAATGGTTDVVLWDDGTRLEYDSAAAAFVVDVQSAGTATVRVGAAQIEADNETLTLKVGGSAITITAGGITIAAPTIGMSAAGGAGKATLAGSFEMDGSLSASGSIMDAGGNSNHHSH